jgi:hypothetical protein
MANISPRANPAQQLAAARERIVAEMDRLQQKIGNLDAQISDAKAQISAYQLCAETARAEEAGLRTALAALGEWNGKAPAPRRPLPPRGRPIATRIGGNIAGEGVRTE